MKKDCENVFSACGAKRLKFSSEQVRSLMFKSEDKEQDQPINSPYDSKLWGVSYPCMDE